MSSTRTSKFLLGSLEIEERRSAIERVYRTADRMILDQQVDVRFVSERAGHGGAVAWTDGVTIYFNQDRIESIDWATMEEMAGLNAHEMAHVALTPRDGSRLRQVVVTEGMHHAFNMLEDSRIETLFGATYPSVKKWYAAVIARYILANDQCVPIVFPLIWGRRYLSQRLRDDARASYVAQDQVDAMAEVIDEYRLLVFPTQQDRGIELVRQFHALITEAQSQMEESGEGDGLGLPDPFGHSEKDPAMDKGRPESVEEQREAVEREQEQDERREQGEQDLDTDEPKAQPAQGETDEPDDDSGEDQDETDAGGLDAAGDGDPSDDETDAQGEGGTSGDSSEAGQSGDESSDSSDGDAEQGDAGSDSDSTEGQAEASNTAPSTPGGVSGRDSDPDVLAAARELLERLTRAADYRSEIERIQKQVLHAGAADSLPMMETSERGPDASGMAGYRQFARVLARIRQQTEMGWDRRTDRGRVNAVRYAIEGNRDEAFDQWEEGMEDALDIEYVLVYDYSHSMMGQMWTALQSVWGIKRAMDEVGATGSVIGFNTSAQWLYKPGERASRTTVRDHRAAGSTRANAAITQALRLMAASKRSLKILIVITDGEWADPQPYSNDLHCDNMIARMGQAGVVTAVGYLADDESMAASQARFRVTPHLAGSPATWEEAMRHKAQIFTRLMPGQLTEFGQAIITNAIRRRMAKH